jgi:hypothetical protein
MLMKMRVCINRGALFFACAAPPALRCQRQGLHAAAAVAESRVLCPGPGTCV